MNTDVKIFFELMFLYSWNNCHKVESLNHLEHSQTFLGPFFHLLSHPPCPPVKIAWYFGIGGNVVRKKSLSSGIWVQPSWKMNSIEVIMFFFSFFKLLLFFKKIFPRGEEDITGVKAYM